MGKLKLTKKQKSALISLHSFKNNFSKKAFAAFFKIWSCTYQVLCAETGSVHHQQLDHLEAVYPHRIVHRRVSVLQPDIKTDAQQMSHF